MHTRGLLTAVARITPWAMYAVRALRGRSPGHFPTGWAGAAALWGPRRRPAMAYPDEGPPASDMPDGQLLSGGTVARRSLQTSPRGEDEVHRPCRDTKTTSHDTHADKEIARRCPTGLRRHSGPWRPKAAEPQRSDASSAGASRAGEPTRPTPQTTSCDDQSWNEAPPADGCATRLVSTTQRVRLADGRSAVPSQRSRVSRGLGSEVSECDVCPSPMGPCQGFAGVDQVEAAGRACHHGVDTERVDLGAPWTADAYARGRPWQQTRNLTSHRTARRIAEGAIAWPGGPPPPPPPPPPLLSAPPPLRSTADTIRDTWSAAETWLRS